MLKLIEYIQHGWPSHQIDFENSTEPYFNFHDELSVYDGLVVKGSRIIIPVELRCNILKCLNKSTSRIYYNMGRAKISFPGQVLQRIQLT